MSEIIEQAINALHAYIPFLPAVKTGHPRRSVRVCIVLGQCFIAVATQIAKIGRIGIKIGYPPPTHYLGKLLAKIRNSGRKIITASGK